MNKDTLKSTEFLMALAIGVGSLIAGLAGVLPAAWAGMAATISAAAYALARGIAKYNADFQKGIQTTEFWLALLTVAGTVAATVPGSIPTKIGAVLAAIVAAFYAASRGLAKPSV